MSNSTTPTTLRSERSNSVSSDGSGSSPRRKSSSTLFEGLQAQKRGSTDPAHVARRMSLHDQRPQAGLFGKMWNNWVRGSE